MQCVPRSKSFLTVFAVIISPEGNVNYFNAEEEGLGGLCCFLLCDLTLLGNDRGGRISCEKTFIHAHFFVLFFLL